MPGGCLTPSHLCSQPALPSVHLSTFVHPFGPLPLPRNCMVAHATLYIPALALPRFRPTHPCIWGSGPYIDDLDIISATLHAGRVQWIEVREARWCGRDVCVKVQVLPRVERYFGSWVLGQQEIRLVSKWPRTQSWQDASVSFRCPPFTLRTSLTDIVGYVVFQSEEAPPLHQYFHQPVVPPYVLTLPHSPLHLHQYPITSNQLLHKGSVVSQDSDQPAAQHSLSPSGHHLHLLAQL